MLLQDPVPKPPSRSPPSPFIQGPDDERLSTPGRHPTAKHSWDTLEQFCRSQDTSLASRVSRNKVAGWSMTFRTWGADCVTSGLKAVSEQ